MVFVPNIYFLEFLSKLTILLTDLLCTIACGGKCQIYGTCEYPAAVILNVLNGFMNACWEFLDRMFGGPWASQLEITIAAKHNQLAQIKVNFNW